MAPFLSKTDSSLSRNLFLGNYIPYQHETPLWELETDYYLHNFHSRAGRGTVFSMNSFKRTFGIDAMHQKKDVDGRGDEPLRIAQVRQQVEAQGESLSIWWKVALQTNLQQRMWMKLGQLAPTESFLPSKYERLYQPDKIAQFDRFFARGWATPLRRSHSAQHVDSSEGDSEGNTLTRSLGRHLPHSESIVNDRYTKKISDVHSLPGIGGQALSSLVEYYEEKNLLGVQKDFLGIIDLSEGSVPEEYMRYCAPPSAHAPSTPREKAAAEFQMRLHDCSLDADDVNGIRKVSFSLWSSDCDPNSSCSYFVDWAAY